MNVMFVPSIGLPDSIPLLERLAASIDYPIARKVIWNNGIEGVLDKFADEHSDWIVIESPTGNKGVADSWNECAKLFPEHSAWMLCNEDCWFLPGQLKTICECSDAHPTEPLIYLNSSQAYYCFVWHEWGKENVGEFDANFWPAYYEDCDYKVRLRLMGITGHSYAIEGKPVVQHGKPKTGGMNYSAMINGCGLINRVYWRLKWGNQSFDISTYTNPYKDHRLEVNQWAWNPNGRAIRREIYDAWLSLPNPSIYE